MAVRGPKDLKDPEMKKARLEVLESNNFRALIKNLYSSIMVDQSITDTKKVSILHAMWDMRYRNEDVIEKICESFMVSKVVNIQTVTNLLYILGKFQFSPKST